mgnify:CR=1 FL=1
MYIFYKVEYANFYRFLYKCVETKKLKGWLFMGNLDCDGVISNCLYAQVPSPPKAIEGLLSDYQNFWVSVFARAYQPSNNPLGTMPAVMPKLTGEEKEYIENITHQLHSAPEWKEYTRQCRNWATLM